jgi:hypothetical protein
MLTFQPKYKHVSLPFAPKKQGDNAGFYRKLAYLKKQIGYFS